MWITFKDQKINKKIKIINFMKREIWFSTNEEDNKKIASIYLLKY